MALLTFPAGIARSFVRGFLASMSASASRLNPIAALRAPTIARRMKKTVRAGGSAYPAPVSRAARNIPTRANGSAKTVCATLIISR